MASRWSTVKFGDLYAEPSRNGVSSPKAGRGTGVSMLGMGDVFANGRIRRAEYERVPLAVSELARSSVLVDDLLFARRSLTLAGAGKCSIVSESFEATFESSLIRVRLDAAIAVPAFYYYFFGSYVGRKVMETIVEQTAVAGIRSSDLSKLDVPLPPLEEQRRIAAVLGAFDDKIELNGRMAQTLGDVAQAIFKSWFVDRISGSAVSGALPEGWRWGTLDDLVELRVDRVKPGAETESQPYVPLECLSAKSLALSEYRPGSEAKSSLTRFRRGDILFGAYRPYFHKVNLMPFDGVTRTTAFVLAPRHDSDRAFALLRLFQEETVEYATAHSEGTTIPYAKWKGSLASMTVPIPPKSRRLEYAAVVDPMLERQTSLRIELETLAETRDALLPGLISGELRVPDTGTLVEKVV